MDVERFGAVIRVLGETTSRRGALAALAATTALALGE